MKLNYLVILEALFKPTKNKEFIVKSSTADSIVLSELVKSVRIKISVAVASPISM